MTSDLTSDLLEQQQAREQTRLLDRFKQLREWQTQQQQQLMRQQEQQLAQFHSEQEKLQQFILRQRNAHWGSNPSPPQHNGRSMMCTVGPNTYTPAIEWNSWKVLDIFSGTQPSIPIAEWQVVGPFRRW